MNSEYSVGILTAGEGTVTLGLINSQENKEYKVRAVVYAPYHNPRHFRALRMDLRNQANEMGIPVYSFPRTYSWEKTSMEVLKKLPEKIRGYERSVVDSFNGLGINLVLLVKWDQILSKYLFRELEVPLILSTHPDNRKKYMGVGMDHYSVLEEALKAGEKGIQPIIMRVEPRKSVDGGKIVLEENDFKVPIPSQLVEMHKENPVRAVGMLDELVDRVLIGMYPRAIEKLFS